MNDFYKDFADEIALVNYNPWQSAYDNDINEIKAYAPNYIEKCLSGGTVKLILVILTINLCSANGM